jgi:hypothetical protein
MPAAAAINYSSAAAIRQVTAVANLIGGTTGDIQTDDTNALGPWAASVNASYATPNVGAGAATASQISSLGSLEMSMRGTLAAEADESHFGSAYSLLSVSSFVIDSDTPYVSMLNMTGSVGLHHFRLEQSSGFPTYEANSSGTLPAGSYFLSIQFELSHVGQGSSSGDYSYFLSFVPEPSSILVFGGILLSAGATRRR